MSEFKPKETKDSQAGMPKVEKLTGFEQSDKTEDVKQNPPIKRNVNPNVDR